MFASLLLGVLSLAACEQEPETDPCAQGYLRDGGGRCVRWRRLSATPRSGVGLLLPLSDGRLLAFGVGAFVFDVDHEAWREIAKPPFEQFSSALAIGDRVLGFGFDTSSDSQFVAIWDPKVDVWSRRSEVPSVSIAHALLLADDRVLIVGGEKGTGLRKSWIYRIAGNGGVPDPIAAADPPPENTDVFSAVVRLADGRALFAGGHDSQGALAAAHIYDPRSDRWSGAAPMTTPRSNFTMLPLHAGNVLALGGVSSPEIGLTATVEIYAERVDNWRQLAPLPVPAISPAAVELADGSILVLGGRDRSKAQIYDPALDQWSVTVAPSGKGDEWALSLLPDGRPIAKDGQSTFVLETM